jgi:hypothetical protein
MIVTLKIFAFIFILNNIFYLKNYKRLDKPFKDRDRSSILDLIYYINKVLFLIWLILLIWTVFKFYSITLISIILLRIPLLFLSNRMSSLIFRLTPIINIISLIMLLTH